MSALHVYAAHCSWSGSIHAAGTMGPGIPCCPHCRSVLFQIDEETWRCGIPIHEAKGHLNFGEFMLWKEAQARCWPSLQEAAAAFTDATGKHVVLRLEPETRPTDAAQPNDTVYESCEAANNALGPCPRALVGSDGGHWWYIDHEAEERAELNGKERDFIHCVCKSCPQRMRLSIDAEEFPL